jgi:hypothetical protein
MKTYVIAEGKAMVTKNGKTTEVDHVTLCIKTYIQHKLATDSYEGKKQKQAMELFYFMINNTRRVA